MASPFFKHAADQKSTRSKPATWPLILVTFLVSALLAATSTYAGCTVNLPVQMYLDFQNTSFHAHYGYYLNEEAASSIWAFTISSTAVTSLIAALLVPWTSNRFGNRIAAFGFGGAVICIGSALGAVSKWCNSFELMILSLNFSYGFGWSFGCGCGIAYLLECAPPHLRGVVGIYATFGMNVGQLIAYALGFEKVLGSAELWPFYWGMAAVPAAIAVLICPFVWESPKRAFFFDNDAARTRASLTAFYGASYACSRCGESTDDADAGKPLDDQLLWASVLKNFELEREQAPKFLPLRTLFTAKHLREATLLITATALFNNVCGPSITDNYSTAIYARLGFGRLAANLMSLAMMLPIPLINVVTGRVVDRLGRRPLMIGGGLATLLTLLLYVVFAAVARYYDAASSISYLAAGCLLLNNWSSAVPFSVANFLYAELVPQYALGMTTMLELVTANLFYMVSTQLFPPLQAAIDVWAMLVLGAIPSALSLAYIWRNQQETKCKPTNEIAQFWMDSSESGHSEHEETVGRGGIAEGEVLLCHRDDWSPMTRGVGRSSEAGERDIVSCEPHGETKNCV